MAILAELRDPRVQGVTVTHVEVSGDLRYAKVHVSVLGDERQQKLCLHGLQSSAGFLQSKIAKRVEMRFTPKLTFVLDPGVKRSIEIAQILKRVLPPEPTPEDDEAELDESAEEEMSPDEAPGSQDAPPNSAADESSPSDPSHDPH